MNHTNPDDEAHTERGQPAAEAADASAASGGADGEDPLAALEAARAEAMENRDAALRARAELENFRRRMAREMESVRKYALERFMGDLLEVHDSLDRGLEAARGEQATVDQIREGTELTHRLLDQVLNKHGLEIIDPTGEKFDPERHEAMSMVPTDEHAPDTVVMVVQKGFLLNDRLLRPARVIVAKPAA